MASGGLTQIGALYLREPWAEMQVASRLAVLGHVFHYTYPVLMELPFDHWLLLAFAHDEYVDEMKKQRPRRR